MSVKIPVTRVKKSQQAPPAVSPVTTIFYPGDWNFLRTHLASSFIIILTLVEPEGSFGTRGIATIVHFWYYGVGYHSVVKVLGRSLP